MPSIFSTFCITLPLALQVKVQAVSGTASLTTFAVLAAFGSAPSVQPNATAVPLLLASPPTACGSIMSSAVPPRSSAAGAARLLSSDSNTAAGGANGAGGAAAAAAAANGIVGAAYLVARGECSFLDKALAVRAAGGSAMLLYDSVPGCVAMGSDPNNATAASVNITAVSVTQQVRSQ